MRLEQHETSKERLGFHWAVDRLIPTKHRSHILGSRFEDVLGSGVSTFRLCTSTVASQQCEASLQSCLPCTWVPVYRVRYGHGWGLWGSLRPGSSRQNLERNTAGNEADKRKSSGVASLKPLIQAFWYILVQLRTRYVSPFSVG